MGSQEEGPGSKHLTSYIFLGITQFAEGGGYDHIVIPGGQCNSPVSNAVTAINVLNDRYCGTGLYCLGAVPTATIAAAATDATVCTNQKPFKISVKSDGLEYNNPTTLSESVVGNNVGFSISNYLVVTFTATFLIVFFSGYFMRTTCLTRPPPVP